MLLEAIRYILTEYQPVISILDPFQANFCNLISLNFPRFSKNLHKLTPGGSGRPTTNVFGIIVGRKWSKSFIDFTRFPTPRPQMFMPTDPDFRPLDLRFLTLGSQISDPCSSDFHARLLSKYGLTGESIPWKFSHW